MKKKDANELKHDYLGHKFNKLTVIDVYYDESKKDWLFTCMCECGEQCNKSMRKVVSGHTKTCGGTIHKLEQGREHSKWLHDHWDVVLKVAENNKEWYKANTDKVKQRSANHSAWWNENRGKVDLSHPTSKIKRMQASYKSLLPILHQDYHEKLLSGDIKRDDIILTKCPVCGNYDEHSFHNVYRLATDSLKYDRAPLCRKCNMSHISHYEQDIIEYISTFYFGECIRNDRLVLNGKELDIYYPAKKIAIEFNGDYWHSDKYKSSMYHYNKFKQCYDLGITLVSIFEREWYTKENLIRLYIRDLFNGITNKLSYLDTLTLNLNYPECSLSLFDYSIITNSSYIIESSSKVYTCGYANNSLKFLADIANENNLQYFINDHNDLEIKDKNICFHLADLLSGEKDAPERWQMYHDLGKRCVFIYQPDLKNENRVNVYKNILLYHCGLAKRIYARNTVVKKYKAIEMKRFFEENNIAGYRNASVAYVLEDKLTHEPYMCYLIGHNYFGKGSYDCEIARGACKLGYQIVGGASKLWKHIIDDNHNINSIVYYCDKRQYDQRSISHLMDSNAMKGLGTVHMLKGSSSFMNYWVNDTYIGENLWHKAGEFTNREPSKHKLVMDAIHNGDCISVVNPGSFTNIFVRTGYHLEGMKVVHD